MQAIRCLLIATVAIGGCAFADADDSSVEISSYFDFGSAADYERGVTAVQTPYRVFVFSNGVEITSVLQATDPNNGCPLFLASEFTTDEFVEDAMLYDQCHGHQYSETGDPLDGEVTRSIRQVDFEVRDGRLIWDTSTTLSSAD